MKHFTWDWTAFAGSRECLMSNKRDLAKLALAVRLCRDKRSVVQAGGNLGIFPKYLSEFFDRVYTFEPDPENFLKLCENAPEPNIVHLQAALHRQSGFVGTKHGSPTHTHEGVATVTDAGPIPALPLDAFNFQTLDLLYLDIEGFEHNAVIGARNTIDKTKPVVVLEMNVCLERQGSSHGALWHYMQSLGYVNVFTLYTDEVFVHESRLDYDLYDRLDNLLGPAQGVRKYSR